MTVDVLIPWRAGCPQREAALAWVVSTYRAGHPDWTIRLGVCPTGPWRKAAAVTDALSRSTAPVVVVADADVWCDSTAAAVEAVQAGAPWATPHRLVRRLDQNATGRVLAGERINDTTWPLAQRPYEGIVGGGIVVMSADLARSVPLDPRFEGWGQEDRSWGVALTRLAGPAARLDGDLWHLWHPPAERVNRVKGSESSWRLADRYRRARTQQAMRALIDEVQVAS